MKLPNTIFTLYNLKDLSFESQQLTGELIISRKVETINVNSNSLTSISIANDVLYTVLEELNMEYNNFDDKIFETIPKLNKLRILDIAGNKNVVNIPQNISELTLLEDLNLESTGIKNLPSNIFKLSNLRSLILTDNLQLYTKLIKFEESVKRCVFDFENIECYQIGACEDIDEIILNRKKYCEKEVTCCSYEKRLWNTLCNDTNQNLNDTPLRICTEDEVNEVLKSQVEIKSNNRNPNRINENNIYKIIIIFLIIIGNCIILYVLYICYYRKHENNNSNIKRKHSTIFVERREIIGLKPKQNMNYDNNSIEKQRLTLSNLDDLSPNSLNQDVLSVLPSYDDVTNNQY